MNTIDYATIGILEPKKPRPTTRRKKNKVLTITDLKPFFEKADTVRLIVTKLERDIYHRPDSEKATVRLEFDNLYEDEEEQTQVFEYVQSLGFTVQDASWHYNNTYMESASLNIELHFPNEEQAFKNLYSTLIKTGLDFKIIISKKLKPLVKTLKFTDKAGIYDK